MSVHMHIRLYVYTYQFRFISVFAHHFIVTFPFGKLTDIYSKHVFFLYICLYAGDFIATYVCM